MPYQCRNDLRPIVIESYHANDCSACTALADVLSVFKTISVHSVDAARWRRLALSSSTVTVRLMEIHDCVLRRLTAAVGALVLRAVFQTYLSTDVRSSLHLGTFT